MFAVPSVSVLFVPFCSVMVVMVVLKLWKAGPFGLLRFRLFSTIFASLSDVMVNEPSEDVPNKLYSKLLIADEAFTVTAPLVEVIVTPFSEYGFRMVGFSLPL